MSGSRFSRRNFLVTTSTLLAGVVASACGQRATPTTTPANKDAGAPGTAATPEFKPGASQATITGASKIPTTGPAAAAQPTGAVKPETGPGGLKGQLSIAVWTDAIRTWQDVAAKQFAQNNPDVDLKIEQVPYAEMDKKQLAWLATNTMPDLVFSGVKWFAYSAYKGAFLALDDLVNSNNYDLNDYFKGAIQNSTFEGKLYALPFEVNTGNTNIMIYNQTYLEEKGVPAPTKDWTYEQFGEMAAKLTDRSKNIFGTNYLTTNYYDFATLTRSYGEEILRNEGKEFVLASNQQIVDAARWETSLRTELNAAPNRGEAEGLAFPAGQLGIWATGIYSVIGTSATVGDKFKWGAVLGPTGPGGLRGYEIFTTMYSIFSKTKDQKLSFELLKHLMSKETAMFAFVEQGQPPARASIWSSDEAKRISPIYPEAAEWLTDGKNQGPFPMPYNLRFSELQDKWNNLATPLFYGEVPFEEQIQKISEECSQIVSQPRN